MRKTRGKGMVGIVSTALVSIALLSTGCGSDTGSEPAPAVETPPVAVYSVLGQVDSVPPSEGPLDRVAVHHEAIPEFIGIGGDPEPMQSMTMTFPVANSVDLSSVSDGDKVRIQLEIDWSAGNPARILAIEVLPPETELDFGTGKAADHADH